MLEAAQPLALRIDWGDVPTWLATIGAIVAAFFAGWALRVEMRRDDHRQAVEDKAGQEALKAQAATVAAWPTSELIYEDAGPGVPSQLRRRFSGWIGGVRVQNTSDVPVYKMTIILWRAGTHEAETFLQVVPPGLLEVPEKQFQVHTEHWRRKADGQTEYAFEDYQVEIVFTDASNRRWRRQSDGRLLEAPG